MQIARGMVIAGFRLDELIGEGGMGVVWKARQLDLDRVLAKFGTGRMLAALVAATTIALVPLGVSASAEASSGIPLRSCPPYDASQGLAAGPFAVRVHHISCSQGKRVARIVVRHGKDALPTWICSFRIQGTEGTVTTCRRGGRIVRFFSGG